MKNSLRRLTALAGAFAVGALIAARAVDAQSHARMQPGSSPPHSGIDASRSANDGLSASDRLLVEAAARLERRASVTARLRHQTSINGQLLYGAGSYWQQGTGSDLRIRLELQFGREATMSQISNGRFLWVDRQLPTGRTVTRVDLRKLRSDPVLAAAKFDGVRPGQANWSSAQSDIAAQIGGLPRILAALRDNFAFFPPQAMRLVAANESEGAGVPYFAVVGRWRTEKLAELVARQGSTPENQPPMESFSLPGRLPHEVLLLFGQADLFPYRIEYRHVETPSDSDARATAPVYQLSNHPMSVLEFSDVVFDAPIAPSQFDYAPPDVDWVDHTATVIEKMRRESQANVAARAQQGAQSPPVR
jgi:hypothetical protein